MQTPLHSSFYASRCKLYLNLLPIAYLAFVLVSCVATPLRTESLTDDVILLAASNRKPIYLDIKVQNSELTVGRQFLLMLIPFGRVYLPAPETFVSRAVYQELSLRGYKPIVDKDIKLPAPRLIIELEDMDVSAYDFLFLRRVVAKTSLKGTFYHKDDKTVYYATSKGRVSHGSKYAFAPTLTHSLNKALKESVKKLLNELGL